MGKQIFIFGLGYIGDAFAAMMAKAGYEIAGTVRTPQKQSHRAAEGWKIYPYQHTEQPVPQGEYDAICAAVGRADIVLSTIALKGGRDPVMADFQDMLLAYTGWAGYLSVTSVYASQSEGWVDEHTPPAPLTDRGRARLAAEQAWLRLPQAEIFRLGGIYGPHRNPFAALKEGTAQIIEKPGQLFNRMHQHDMCRVLASACTSPRAGRIINLVDGVPAAQGDMIRYAAALLGITPPKPVAFEDAKLSEMGKSFYQTSRSIRSVIIRPELGLELAYPDYRCGLDACIKAETDGHK